MIAKFKIDLDDLVAVQSFLANNSKFHKRNKLILSFLAAIGVIILNMLIFKVNIIIILIVSAALFYVSYNYIYKKSIVDQTKRIAKNDPALLNAECTLTISKSGLYRELKNSTNKIEWQEIKLVSEDVERYLIMISDIHVIVIKKNPDNMSEGETQEYNKLLRNYFDQHNIVVE